MHHFPHRFERPLSDGILVAAIIGAVALISALPALSVAMRGIQ